MFWKCCKGLHKGMTIIPAQMLQQSFFDRIFAASLAKETFQIPGVLPVKTGG